MTPKTACLGAAFGAVLVLLLHGALIAQPAPEKPKPAPVRAMLIVCQDEATIERTIHAYIKAKYGVEGEIRAHEEDDKDVFLEYTLGMKGVPAISATVDTLVTNEARDGRVVERRVEVHSYFELPKKLKTPEVRAKLLDLNNHWMQEEWMPGRVYVDTDGDLALETCVNIPGPDIEVHPELVYDLLHRTMVEWRDYYGLLKKEFDLE